VRVESGVDVARPPAEVFAYISNFEHNPEWQGGMVDARFTTKGPLRVGSRYDQVAKFMGKRIDSSFEVVEYEPDRLVKATTTSSSFPITFTRKVEPAGDGTRVTAIVEGDASGFFRLAEPLMRRKVQKSIDADYENLKRILEDN
jgi:carbon monoxide dehydrogenase subunit G